jgi:hypothetical protein
MGCQHHGGAFSDPFQKDLKDFPPGGGILHARRLVGKDKPGFGGKGPRDGNTLPLTP